MTIGQRIKNRRLELNLSVEDVAKRLGKNRATVYRYENDGIKELPITVLEPLAKVLETTPADLMGWVDEESIGEAFYRAPVNSIKKMITSEFGKEEAEHFELYTELTTTNQKKVNLYTKNLLSNQQMEYELNAAHERTDISITDEMKVHDDDIMMSDDEWK